MRNEPNSLAKPCFGFAGTIFEARVFKNVHGVTDPAYKIGASRCRRRR
jgi:hypothetical protein